MKSNEKWNQFFRHKSRDGPLLSLKCKSCLKFDVKRFSTIILYGWKYLPPSGCGMGRSMFIQSKPPKIIYYHRQRLDLIKILSINSQIENMLMNRRGIFLSGNVTKFTSSLEGKSIVLFLKRVSFSLMTCQKLYSKHFSTYKNRNTNVWSNHVFETEGTKYLFKNLSLET